MAVFNLRGRKMKIWAAAVLVGTSTLLTAQGASAAEGSVVYAQTCAACHASGVAGAPKTGDKTGWAPRLAAGREAMLTVALKGKGAMPPKGGNASLSDAEVKSAMDYMLSQIK